MHWFFTGKRLLLRITRVRKSWFGPFETREEAVRWANRNGYPKIK